MGNPEPSFIEIISATTLIAVIGGVVKYLQKWSDAGKRKFFTKELFVGAVVSAFIGMIVGLALYGLGVNYVLATSISGLAGYMGAMFLSTITDELSKRVRSLMKRIFGE